VTLPETIPLLGIGWDDLLFLALAGVMLVSALLVVTMRDIIRCGLAMIVSFGALAGIYVLAGAPFLAGAQVLVYIGAISVLILFAIMLTQTKDAPSRLVFQTQAGPAAIAAVVMAFILGITVVATDWSEASARSWTWTGTAARGQAGRSVAEVLFTDYVLPFEVVSVLLLAAVIGGLFVAMRSGRTPRTREGRSDGRLPAGDLAVARRLPRPVGDPVLHRRVRLPGPPQRDQHADVRGADAQRGEPRDHRVRGVHPALNPNASVIALVVMASAAAEATVGLAIVIAIFRNRKTPLVDEYDAMRQ